MSDQILHVDRAQHVRDYLLDITFDNGIRKTVDLEPLLTGEMFEPLRDVDQFSKLTIDPISKTIVWPKGADLAPEALFELPNVDQVA
mgnify:CR=1 FL=1